MRLFGVAMVLGMAAAALGTGCGQATKVDSIEITADSLAPLPKGTTRQYSAIAHYSDNTTVDVTSLVKWQASSDAIVAVSNNTGSRGLVTASNFGQILLSATYNDAVGTATVAVTAAALRSILLSPQNPVLANGTTIQLAATGVYSDLSNQDLSDMVTWKSADENIATVTASGAGAGLVSGRAPGVAALTASLFGVDSQLKVTVTSATLKQLAVTPAAATLAKGTTLQLVATGTFSDNTTQDVTSLASWTTADSTIGTVSSQSGSRGLVAGVSKGLIAITAALNGQTAKSNLTVSDATLASITVTPASPAIANGSTAQLSATGNFSDGTTQNLSGAVTWLSSQPTVAAVSAQGLASALGKGQTSISAALMGRTGSTTLTVSDAVLTAIAVTPASQTLAAGTNLQLVATGMYSDNTTQDITSLVSWTSTSAASATVSSGAGSRGLVRGVNAGTATITAALGSVSGDAMLTVTSAALSSIVVTPATHVIASGTTQQLVATGLYSDGTSANLTAQVAWSSSDNMIATISNVAGSIGLATGAARGSVTVTATLGLVSGATTLAVSSAVLTSIQVAAGSTSLAKGTAAPFTATGIYSDSTNQDITSLVTWTSSIGAVATISNAAGSRGLATAAAAGTTVIQAALGAVTGSRGLTVTSATLAAIVVTPGASFLARGTQQSFTATGVFSDGTQQDLTTSVSWSSDAAATATVDNSSGSEGLVTALAAGSANIKALDASTGKSGTTRVTVTSAALVSIAITPGAPAIAKGTMVQFTATGTYNDGRKQDLTQLVTWSSTSAGVSIDNNAGSEGLATGLAVGTATITAQLSGKTSTTTLTVTSAALTALAITPAGASLPASFSQQYVAIGTYSDGSTQILTSDPALTWSSSDAATASVSNASGTEGLVLGIATGTVTIKATLGAISGSTSVTVTSAVLATLAVQPATATIAAGSTQQFTAMGTFDDGTQLDLTRAVTWSSDDPLLVAIDTAGLAMAVGVAGDTAVLTAVLGAVSGTAAVTIN